MSLPCHHRNVSRLRAEELLLAAQEDGSYLVRDSESIQGAYTLCILFKGRIHQYRVLPCGDGKLSIQSEKGVQDRKFVSLQQLIHEYTNRGENNGLVCALKVPVPHDKVGKQDTDYSDSDDEDFEDVPDPRPVTIMSSPDDDDISRQLMNKFSKLDLSSCDGSFIDSLRSYAETGARKDAEALHSGNNSMAHLHQLLATATTDLEKQLNIFQDKLHLCEELFCESTPRTIKEDKSADNPEEKQVNLEKLLDRLGNVNSEVTHLHTKISTALQDFNVETPPDFNGSLPLLLRPQAATLNQKNVPLKTSVRRPPIPPTSFEVKMEKVGKNAKATLTVDIQAGKLFAVKPSKEVLDDSNTFTHEKVLQLIKHTDNNCRLDLFIEGRKKETYTFEDIRTRENFCQLVQQMKNMHSASQDVDLLSVFIGTWNMGDASPPWNIAAWIKCQGSGKGRDKSLSLIPHDVYVIGTQETALTEKEWTNKLRNTLKDCLLQEFQVVDVVSLWSLRLVVLVKPEHRNKISHVMHSTVKTGIANALGNKGAVGVSLHFNGTSFCFINCHLTSGSEKNHRRNQNYRDILKGLSLGSKQRSMFDLTNQFHHVFWFGDLNYRVEEEVGPILSKVKIKDYKELLLKDQLKMSKDNKETMVHFNEEFISFPPTYRYARGSDTDYNWKKVKKTGVRINVPSWCDRVLWKSYPQTYLKNNAYGSVDDITTSDHKPVFASFDVGIMAAFVPSKNESNEDEVKIVFDKVQVEVQTSCKPKFQLEIHSKCLDRPVTTKPNNNYNSIDGRQGTFCGPTWEKDLIPEIFPVFSDVNYLEEQHLLVAVKTTDGDESFGECVIALESKFSILPQPFSCFLVHQGEETGKLSGTLHMVSKNALVERKTEKVRKSYELVYLDTDIHARHDPPLVPTAPPREPSFQQHPSLTKAVSLPENPVDQMVYNEVYCNQSMNRQSESIASNIQVTKPKVAPRSPNGSFNIASRPPAVPPRNKPRPLEEQVYNEMPDDPQYTYTAVQGNELEDSYESVPPPLPKKSMRCVSDPGGYAELMGPHTVNEFLLNLGIPEYIPIFMNSGWDSMGFMHELTREDLLDMHIANEDHILRILNAVKL